MTKAELIEEVSRVVEMTRKDSEVIVEAIFDSVVRSLRTGDKIEIRGFGSFRTRQRQPRVGRNPKTGARVEVPAKRIPYFKPSKELKDLVNTDSVGTGEAPPVEALTRSSLTDLSLRDLTSYGSSLEPVAVSLRLLGVPDDECFLCRKASDSDDHKNYILVRAEHNFVLLNLYPYTSGHLMIAPYAHVSTLAEVDVKTLGEMMSLAQRMEAALREAYHPGGFNLGMNIGRSAGAGVPGHLHMHVLPRWTGDVNFMTTIGETRVLPEDLDTTYTKLLAGLKEAALKELEVTKSFEPGTS